MTSITNEKIKEEVRDEYGKIALSQDSGCGCTTSACCSDTESTVKTRSQEMGYSKADVEGVPEGANLALGCGNPKAIASLKPGETVLDLGSGAGFDCFLALKEVGETGFVIGVDMTPEMVSKARKNALKIEAPNIDFRLGEIENLPIADKIIDVIISNCVINLSPEKEKVFREAYRVLKPGGRLAISDIVASIEIPEDFKKDMAKYTSCVSGAESAENLEVMLKSIGFDEIRIQPKDESREFIKDWAPDSNIEDYVVSATIKAVKPG